MIWAWESLISHPQVEALNYPRFTHQMLSSRSLLLTQPNCYKLVMNAISLALINALQSPQQQQQAKLLGFLLNIH